MDLLRSCNGFEDKVHSMDNRVVRLKFSNYNYEKDGCSFALSKQGKRDERIFS